MAPSSCWPRVRVRDGVIGLGFGLGLSGCFFLLAKGNTLAFSTFLAASLRAWLGLGLGLGSGFRSGLGLGLGVGLGLGLGLGLGPRSCSTPSACPWCSTHAGHMQGTCRAHAHAHAHAHAVYAEHLPRDGEPGAAVTRLDGHGEQRARGAARGLVRVRARVRVGYGVRG